MKYELICFDMDGVILKDSNFFMEIHQVLRTLEKGKILTEKYLDTNYEKLVKKVVGELWKGRDAQQYFKLLNSLKYNPGVKKTFETIHKKGYKTAIISASVLDCARKVQQEHGVDYIFANDLIIENGKFNGKYHSLIAAGHHNKAEILLGLCKLLNINPQKVLYIGDTIRDLETFKVTGHSIAFNSTNKELKKAATIIIDDNNLSKIILHL